MSRHNFAVPLRGEQRAGADRSRTHGSFLTAPSTGSVIACQDTGLRRTIAPPVKAVGLSSSRASGKEQLLRRTSNTGEDSSGKPTTTGSHAIARGSSHVLQAWRPSRAVNSAYCNLLTNKRQAPLSQDEFPTAKMSRWVMPTQVRLLP